MPDRDKVIRGLECCLTISISCGFCPYFSHKDCERDLQHDVSALLKKKQEAIEPDIDLEGTCSCGNCGTTIGYYPAGCSVPKKLCKYCPECGYEVKWE